MTSVETTLSTTQDTSLIWSSKKDGDSDDGDQFQYKDDGSNNEEIIIIMTMIRIIYITNHDFIRMVVMI